MKKAEDIIIRPYITERSSDDMADGKYTFLVATNSTKTEVKAAAEKLFNVKVLKVNTANYKGKMKRQGVHEGKTAKFKKAIVKIDLDPQSVVYLEKGGKEKAITKKYKTTIEEFGAGQ
ncbi:MAG: 50S ribosomal protein L23 [Clostridiales bacterium]|nr:50S ribosomal protein L23 [Clostridiales bacterium]